MAQVNQEQYDKLQSVIQEHRAKPGALMPIMQQAQEIFGFLSLDVQKTIAQGLDIPVTDVYGVATFYSQFSLEPKGKNVIGLCMGTACYVRGAQAIQEALTKELGVETGKTTPDGQFTMEPTRCLGCCGLAPVMVINDEVYGRLKPEEIKGILDKYR